MAVCVKGDLDRGVAEVALDGFRMSSLSNQQRRARVTKVMDADLRKSSLLERQLPHPTAKVPVAEWQPILRREDQGVTAPVDVVGQMLCQHLLQELRDRD